MADSQLGIVLRPMTFDDVIGHDEVMATIRAKLDRGEVDRATMFVGPPGTGKTTLAKIIARAAQGWDFPADQEPDVIEVNAANFRKIDDMRQLVDQIGPYPMIGKYRVIILDEAQQITTDAQNLLLKPFEEAGSPNIFIICTTNPKKILEAIRTRCSIHQLKLMTKKNVHDLLVRAAAYLGRAEYTDFEAQALIHKLFQPRPLLSAFENYCNGTPAITAIVAQTTAALPDHFEIAKATVYGSWNNATTVWGKPCKSVKDLLLDLEKTFKKEKSEDDTDEEVVDGEEETTSRPDASRALRAITAALLKSEVIKKGSVKAAEALMIISKCAPDNPFDVPLEYPATIGGLFRVNLKMQSK